MDGHTERETHDLPDGHNLPDSHDLAGGGDCEQALRTLYHFLDGELTPDRRHAIQRHLDQCSPCLEAFDFEMELKVIVARSCRDQVPERLRQRVAAVLIEAERTSGTGASQPPETYV